MQTLEEGQKFGRYRVLRQLGSGVSGISYEAEDMMLQRKITLKLIHPWAPLPDSARRQFFRDLQAISLLTHPYLAPTLDYGEISGQLYLTRRFVPAGSLLGNEGRMWFSPPFSLSSAITYVQQLAQALYSIHRYGYVHAGVTLSNVLVLSSPWTNDKEADFAPFVLADVGVAHFIRRYGQPQITRLPITAAPEQWRGRVTPATDQYALAALLYFWLSGRAPFVGSQEEIEQQKRTATFPLLASLNPHVTLEQEGIIRRALNAYPDERYPSIIAFAQALTTSLSRPAPSLALPELEILSSLPETPSLPAHEQSAPAELDEQDAAHVEAAPDEYTASSIDDERLLEPVSGTFLLDQAALSRLSALAKQVPPAPPQPEPEPQIEPDIPLPRPAQPPAPQPAPEPEPAPRPEPSTEPLPPSEPTPELPPPAPDIPQPIPEPTPPPEIPQPEPSQDPAQALQGTGDLPPLAVTAPTQEQRELPVAHLIISYPYQEEQKVFRLDREQTTLGRAGSSDVLLDQDTITSRHHARITREQTRYTIRDERSMHGVTINGQKIPVEVDYPLSDGDHIGIGEYTLVFYYQPEQGTSEVITEEFVPS